MKVLISGAGSIGLRHGRNVSALDAGVVAFADPDLMGRGAAAAEFGAPVFASLAEGLAWGPDLVVVASPTHLHIAQATEAALCGCHLFVEKPLGHSLEGAETLGRLVRTRRLLTLVGCNMRFHPGPAKVKKLLTDQAIGKPMFARIHTGSYLPAWRPSSDYRKSYSAQIAKGGGCILDCVHEIDLARWYLGEIDNVSCIAGRLSSLEIETEDFAALTCRHQNGAVSEIHLDYVQRTYERGCQIVGELGAIWWDYRAGTVRWFDATRESWTTFHQPPSWQVNDMYVAELRHFMRCLDGFEQPALTVPEAVRVMKIVMAAKRSAESGQVASTACNEHDYYAHTSPDELHPVAR